MIGLSQRENSVEVVINARPKDEEEKEYGKFDKWEIESCVDCLIRAEEIKADPEKMKHVKPILDEKMGKLKKAISSISGLKEKASSISSEETEDEE